MDDREFGIYRCPVCGKPFDVTSKLVDFAISAHEQDHDPSRNTVESLLRLDERNVWCCVLCGHPFSKSRMNSGLSMIDHALDAHGSLPASSVPVATRGGGSRGRRSNSGSKRGVMNSIRDGLQGVGEGLEAVGESLAKLFVND